MELLFRNPETLHADYRFREPLWAGIATELELKSAAHFVPWARLPCLFLADPPAVLAPQPSNGDGLIRGDGSQNLPVYDLLAVGFDTGVVNVGRAEGQTDS